MTHPKTAQKQAVAATHETPGIRLFTPPPASFDPLRASDRELLVHGYPARPDAQLHPELHAHWTTVLSRPMTVITPQLATMPQRRRRARQEYADTEGDGWSGSIAYAADGDGVTFVSGQWTVPAVVVPPGSQGLSACAAWIGIDGMPPSTDILQAGTTQEIQPDVFGTRSSTFAWFEWFPADPCTITNLPVSAGDVMYCVICVYNNKEAAVYLGNLTTGVLASFVKTAPEEVELAGNCAEWILECPQLLSDGQFLELTQFGEVYFDNCIAGTFEQALLFAGDGEFQTMFGNQDDTIVDIATPVPVTDRLFKVQYTAPSS